MMPSSAATLLRGALLLSLPLLAAAAPRSWTVIETARDNGHRLATVAALPAAAESSSPLVLDAATTYQEMVGFGGALTESSAWVLAQLPAAERLEVLRRYYDPVEGIGYTLGRTHLNSCDFSLSLWSLDDTPGDYDLQEFSLAPMRRWVLPLLHDASRLAGPDRFKLLVSPWSPPFWMKTNYRMDDGGSLRREYRPAWARFYVKFVEAMRREEGLGVWALTVQNEPRAKQTWESCLYSPEEERDFVRDHLGPALAAARLSDIKLLVHDHNRDILEEHADATFRDPEASKYVWGVGLHWYVSNDFAASSRVQAKYPEKHVLFTEGCREGGKDLGAWEHGEYYATQMIGDFRNWVVGFLDWNIVLDQRGGPNHVGNFCDAPVIVDTNTKEVRYGASFYYIAHFSKYVKPGARRIAVTGGSAAVSSVAFVNPDGGLVVVAVNAGDAPVDFAVRASGVAVAGKIPAHGIHTYVSAP